MKLLTRRHLKNYAIIQLIDGAVVYAAYTPYVLLWLHLDQAQYWKWLIGGIPMALLFNVLFTPVYAKLLKRFPVIG